ncbi:MAG: hypothetical protein EOL89_05115 [Actinobacteria bacterium]|nr:hypothetical protein [Actinomycetota bacterium]
MTDIAHFLLERIEEDEQIARFVAADSPTDETRYTMWATPSSLDPDQLVVAVDYQRVLAECAAKRRIVEAYLEVVDHDSPMYLSAGDYMETTVRELASVYADHRDYLDDWRD